MAESIVKEFMNRRLGSILLVTGLVLADLLRPYLEPGIPVFQATLALVALAVLWQNRLVTLRAGGERWALFTLAILFALLYLRHPRSLDADGVHYFTYARSLIGDRDLDVENDFALLGHASHALNVLPIGAPLVWCVLLVPLYIAGSLSGALFGYTITGAEPAFIAAACLTSIAFGCAGLFLLYRELRTFVAPVVSLLTILLLWFGTPLRFYMRVLPSFAHAIEFFAGVLVLVASRRLRERADWRSGFLAGLACGLVYLVRTQDGLLLIVPTIFAFDAWLGHRRFALLIRHWAGILLGFAALAWIQSAVWVTMFGTPFLVPHKLIHGAAFTAPTPHYLEMLFSDRGGLFASHPITFLGLILLPWAFRRNPAWAAAAFLGMTLQWLLNSSLFDWYQVRRFTGTLPLISVGLAVLARPLSRAGLAVCAVLLVLVHQYDVAIDSLRPLPGRPVPIQAALSETADSIVSPVYDGMERVWPSLSVAFLEGYTGSALRPGGRSDLDLAQDGWWMRLPWPARRFSEVETEDGSLCRFVDGREARLWLPLRGRGELRLSFEIRAMETETPQTFEVEVNGQVLGRQEIAPSWQTVRFILPASVWKEGTNEVVLRFEHAVHFFRTRGTGPRVFRAAAVRRITIHGGDGPE
jgi:hypothetical protein